MWERKMVTFPVPDDYEYRPVADGSADNGHGRYWKLEQCWNLTTGESAGFRVGTTQEGDDIGELVAVAHGEKIDIEAETPAKLCKELLANGFSDVDAKEIARLAAGCL
jgi:hypothetical protein